LKSEVLADEDKINDVENSLERCCEKLDSESDKDLPDLIEKTHTLRQDWDALKCNLDNLSISFADELERSQKCKFFRRIRLYVPLFPTYYIVLLSFRILCNYMNNTISREK